MQRLPSERRAIGDPPIEVERLAAWPIHRAAVARSAAFFAAPPEAEVDALRRVYDLFVVEAQPTWDLWDHRGPIPATGAGMLRLPLKLALSYVDAWMDTIIEPTTAVDEMVPPGPLRDELKEGLKAARRRKG